MDKNFMRAYCDADKARGEEPGTPIPFIAATEGLKKDGIDLRMEGAKLERFGTNPVVTWAHDLWGNRLPIGRAEARVEDGALKADIFFDQEDEFARQVESKYRRGFLSTVSVTFDITQRDQAVAEEWELLEIAGVPVPLDPDALMERQMTGLRSLQQNLNELLGESEEEEDAPEASLDGDVEFFGVAAQMAQLFRGSTEVPEDERAAIYKTLARQYRKLKKEPPELLSADALEAIRPEERAGLFLEGELAALDETLAWFGTAKEAPAEADETTRQLEQIHKILVQSEEVLEEGMDERWLEIREKLDAIGEKEKDDAE